ncbi:MAG: LysE family transporter [Sphingobacteriaceae bacterium]|nr:LysE family transporter [Sphingobacteriaceae bacterium]
MLLALIYQTFLIVLFLTFSFGPAFFALINTGIKHGYRAGSLLAIGVVISDFLLCVLMIFLIDYGATNYIKDEKTQRFMGIIAGLILVTFGAFYFKKTAPVKKDAEVNVYVPSGLAMLFKGFFLNILNPAVWFIWLGNVTAVSNTLKYNTFSMILYFGITLGIVLLVELAKVSAAEKLKKFLTEKIMRVINVLTGILLITFGVILVYTHYFN